MAHETPASWLALFASVGGRHEIARIFRVSESTVYRWSRDETRPSEQTRAAINTMCDAKGVSRVYEAGDAAT